MTFQAATDMIPQAMTSMTAQTTVDSGPGAFVHVVAFLH
jgi:hypothetical protein